MSKSLLVVLLSLSCAMIASAQQRYLYMHDYVLNVTDSIAVVESLVWKQGSTSWYQGTLPGREELPTQLPHDSLMKGKTLRMSPAKEYLDILTYPARCAAALRVERADSTRPRCSAMMVGRRWALTATHCVVSLDIPFAFRRDTLRVYPAWDDNALSTPAPFARVVRAYYVRKPSSDPIFEDVMLLELDSDVGDMTGWVGLYTTPSNTWPSTRLGHRLTYPGARALDDTSKVYYSDKLYYRYGEIGKGQYSFYSSDNLGIPGESGSSLVISDNGGYATVGVMSFASQLYTKLIDSTAFDAFRTLMQETTDIADGDAGNEDGHNHASTDAHNGVVVYPNPVDDLLNVQLAKDDMRTIESLDVYDTMGRHVLQATSGSVSCKGLAGGSYVAVAIAEGRRYQSVFVVP